MAKAKVGVKKKTPVKRKPKIPQIDPEELARIALLSPSIEEIAFAFSIPVEACKDQMLREEVQLALELGRGGRKLSLKRAQWKAAMSGNTAMLIWLGKQDLGQSDKGTEGEDAIEMATKITIALKEMQRRTSPQKGDKSLDAKKVKEALQTPEVAA